MGSGESIRSAVGGLRSAVGGLRLAVGSWQLAVTIDIRVIPRSPRTRVDGERAGAILIRLAAPPVDGASMESRCAGVNVLCELESGGALK